MRRSKSICCSRNRRSRQTGVNDPGYNCPSQLSLAGAGGLGTAVTTREFFHTPGGIDEFLLAGEKRMAGGTDADFNVSFGRAGVINRAAGANDVGLLIIGMNVRLHVKKRVRNLAVKGQIRK